jgi:putative solute:sodium symporter small subunit
LEKAVSQEAAFFCLRFLHGDYRPVSVTLSHHKITKLTFMNDDKRLAYWRANLRLVAVCLTIWFVCSYGFGILLVDELNTIRIGGFQLGFWFAQQGSIYIFVLLIFFYAWRMNRMDREHDVHED